MVRDGWGLCGWSYAGVSGDYCEVLSPEYEETHMSHGGAWVYSEVHRYTQKFLGIKMAGLGLVQKTLF